MVCPKCYSENVNAQVVNTTTLKDKHHSIIWWFCVGCWWVPIKWLFFTLPALIFAIFGRKKQKVVNKQKTLWVCQNCRYTWKA
jgi:predicted nucleic-acid-binding Zn-ribbon protein